MLHRPIPGHGDEQVLEAPNMFPDDPDAQQAFSDSLPIIAELLNASARIPANSQAGRTARGAEQQRAVELHVQELTERLQLKAERIGIPLDELIEAGEQAVKRCARAVGSAQPGRVTPPPAANAEHGGRELRERCLAADQAVALATREAAIASAIVRQKVQALWAARAESRVAMQALVTYETGRVAA